MQFQKREPSEIENKEYKNLSPIELGKVLLYYRPAYSEILNNEQFKILQEFAYKMIQSGQNLKDVLWWLDQFMYQKSEFFGLKKDDPIFVKYNLDAEDMLGLVRMAYHITQHKKYGSYFKERIHNYKGGLIKYFIDSTRGAYDYRILDIVDGEVHYDKSLNLDVDEKYIPILQAWDESICKLSKEKKDSLFEKIAGDKPK